MSTIGARETVLILGCGYTGQRVARRLAASGAAVIATSRRPARILDLAGVRLLPFDAAAPGILPALRRELPDRFTVLHSIPVLPGPKEITRRLLDGLGDGITRVVYLPTTGVYGSQEEVNEMTQPEPRTEAARLRVDAERAVLSGPWPAADEEPARQRDIAGLVCGLLGCPVPESAARDRLHETLRANRRVDGRAVCRALGVKLRFPAYRAGIPAPLSPVRVMEKPPPSGAGHSALQSQS